MNERRRAEEALRKQADLLTRHDAIIVRDLNDTITYWNWAPRKFMAGGAKRRWGKRRRTFCGPYLPPAMNSSKRRLFALAAGRGS